MDLFILKLTEAMHCICEIKRNAFGKSVCFEVGHNFESCRTNSTEERTKSLLCCLALTCVDSSSLNITTFAVWRSVTRFPIESHCLCYCTISAFDKVGRLCGCYVLHTVHCTISSFKFRACSHWLSNLGSRVRILPKAWMFVFVDVRYSVLSMQGPCVGLTIC